MKIKLRKDRLWMMNFTKDRVRRAIVVAALLLITVYVLFPVFWMVSTSLKTETESLAIPPTWIPRDFTLFGYDYILQVKPFLMYFKNSFIASGVTAVVSTLIGGFAAYAVSRYRFLFRKVFITLLLGSQMLPGILLVGPYFKVLNKFNLYDTLTGLILGYTAVALPFCVWMLKSYFDSIPTSIDEAAIMDGTSRIKIILRIIFPLAAPGIVATVTFAFLLAWGDLLWALCLTNSETVTTITLGIANCIGEYRIVWPGMMAAALLASIPSVVLYIILQRYLVGGLTAGSLKE